ncbi:LSM-domain-containing protein [Jaminaea rosea]|uniref:U6 snRNA-associated Sm-like protein LSm1 n=1 Tax=Jaminaea rosea TaxID=1569628 RepID=A0A316UUK1_9BASI|nr:LSM-domain-containing protein [Jaminaea rosea]PWN28001.1 LSM-domain-containing protein [Jaminaea rosea]
MVVDASSIEANVLFTTSGALVDCVDKKMMAILRDGKKLIGVLRSYDQFANLVFQDTVERTYVGTDYTDIPMGIYLVRGENVVMLGEIDLDNDPPPAVRPVPAESISQLMMANKEQQAQRRAREKRKAELMKEQKGFCEEGAEGDSY